ncbi:MAG: hypothetical protein ACLGSD_08890 [Acidobacteriota bacterium]
MNWRPILVRLGWLALAVAVLETAAIWICLRSVWTPIERHYLPVYIWCSLPIVTPATAEVRFIWKTGRHRKRELATGEDVVESDGETGMALSQSALDAGWKTLMEVPPQEVPTAKLRPGLADLAFDDESLWSFLFLPKVCGIVAFGYGVFGLVWLGNWFMDWAVERSMQKQRSPWAEPSPSIFGDCAEAAQKFRSGVVALHRYARRRIETHRAAVSTDVAQHEPPVRPPSFAIPIFGVYNGSARGYLWSEQDKIE